jgi:hypothetical protein
MECKSFATVSEFTAKLERNAPQTMEIGEPS